MRFSRFSFHLSGMCYAQEAFPGSLLSQKEEREIFLPLWRVTVIVMKTGSLSPSLLIRSNHKLLACNLNDLFGNHTQRINLRDPLNLSQQTVE